MSEKKGGVLLLLDVLVGFERLGWNWGFLRRLIEDNDFTIHCWTQAEADEEKARAQYHPGHSELSYPEEFFDASDHLVRFCTLSADDSGVMIEELFHAWYDKFGEQSPLNLKWHKVESNDGERTLEDSFSEVVHKLVECWKSLKLLIESGPAFQEYLKTYNRFRASQSPPLPPVTAQEFADLKWDEYQRDARRNLDPAPTPAQRAEFDNTFGQVFGVGGPPQVP